MNIDYFFISKPRCASTHIYEGLTNWDDKIDGNKKYYHFTAKKMKSIFKDYDKKISFAVVRNPYERMVSYYHFHKSSQYKYLLVYCFCFLMVCFVVFIVVCLLFKFVGFLMF